MPVTYLSIVAFSTTPPAPRAKMSTSVQPPPKSIPDSPGHHKEWIRACLANDPTKTQYQLWIFDKTRDDRFPVDGGVFDVGADGEVIVKISPKLFVNEPVLFAVTVEAPGGVVVSKRERIVVTAAPKAG